MPASLPVVSVPAELPITPYSANPHSDQLNTATHCAAEMTASDVPAQPASQPTPALPLSLRAAASTRLCRQRRKFNASQDYALLQEVQAAGTHVAAHGTTAIKFGEVASKLNSTKVLPWQTDVKHCQDRFRLLITQWRNSDRDRALASGGGEEFGDFEQLCDDLHTEMEDTRAERASSRLEPRKRETNLLAAGEEIRTNAMIRPSGRRESRESSSEPTPKKRRTGTEEIDRALTALETAEEQRLLFSGKQDEREEKRFVLETQRFNMEKQAAADKTLIEKRRLDLDEKRLMADDRRATELAEERKVGLEIQSKMLGILEKLSK